MEEDHSPTHSARGGYYTTQLRRTNIDGARATELKTSEIFRIVKFILLLTSGETNTLLSPTKKKKGFSNYGSKVQALPRRKRAI